MLRYGLVYDKQKNEKQRQIYIRSISLYNFLLIQTVSKYREGPRDIYSSLGGLKVVHFD